MGDSHVLKVFILKIAMIHTKSRSFALYLNISKNFKRNQSQNQYNTIQAPEPVQIPVPESVPEQEPSLEELSNEVQINQK